MHLEPRSRRVARQYSTRREREQRMGDTATGSRVALLMASDAPRACRSGARPGSRIGSIWARSLSVAATDRSIAIPLMTASGFSRPIATIHALASRPFRHRPRSDRISAASRSVSNRSNGATTLQRRDVAMRPRVASFPCPERARRNHSPLIEIAGDHDVIPIQRGLKGCAHVVELVPGGLTSLCPSRRAGADPAPARRGVTERRDVTLLLPLRRADLLEPLPPRTRGSSRASSSARSVQRRRLLSTSDCRVSRSASQTSSAASRVQPPAKTERRAKSRCSSVESRS